ncbi:MAG TPA: hypothetical protein VIS06_14090, partial [Mycobacteriales bacterium]
MNGLFRLVGLSVARRLARPTDGSASVSWCSTWARTGAGVTGLVPGRVRFSGLVQCGTRRR